MKNRRSPADARVTHSEEEREGGRDRQLIRKRENEAGLLRGKQLTVNKVMRAHAWFECVI